MASKRVTVGQSEDCGRPGECWLLLDGKHLWGGLPRRSHAEKIADRLNAAFDKVEEGARWDERALCRQVFMRARPSVSLEVSRAEFERLREE